MAAVKVAAASKAGDEHAKAVEAAAAAQEVADKAAMKAEKRQMEEQCQLQTQRVRSTNSPPLRRRVCATRMRTRSA
jgi:hypothetical protein